jgi:short-subunit dehydrogenase
LPKECVTDTLVDCTLPQEYLTKGIDEKTLKLVNNAKESVKNSLAGSVINVNSFIMLIICISALSFYDIKDAIQHLSQALHYLKEKQ